MTRRSDWPWATTALVTANVSMYVIAGSGTEYTGGGVGDTDDGQLPTIGQVTFDAFRNPSTLALATTMAFLIPIAASAERVLDAVTVAATYVVSGFVAGWVELLAAVDSFPVRGAYGATTGLVAVWALTRWHERQDAVLPAAVAVAWLLINQRLHAAGTPWLATAAAAAIGLYAAKGLSTPRSEVHQNPPAGRG